MEDDSDDVVPDVPLSQKLCRKGTPRVTQSTLIHTDTDTYSLFLSAEEGTETAEPFLGFSSLGHVDN